VVGNDLQSKRREALLIVSAAISRSPWDQNWMVDGALIVFSAVRRSLLFLVGGWWGGADRISRVKDAARFRCPAQRGHVQAADGFTSPVARRPEWLPELMATTSSVVTAFVGSFRNRVFTASCTLGMRVMPRPDQG